MKEIEFETVYPEEDFITVYLTEEEYRRGIKNHWITKYYLIPIDNIADDSYFHEDDPFFSCRVYFEKLDRYEHDVLMMNKVEFNMKVPPYKDEDGEIFIPTRVTFEYLRDADRRLTEEDRKNRESIKKALAESNSKKR